MKVILIILAIVLSNLSFGQQTKPLAIVDSENSVKIVLLNQSDAPANIKAFEKIEYGIKLPLELESKVNAFLKTNKGGLNPFEPDDISLEAVFTSEKSTKTNHINGFYYQHYSKDVRFNRLVSEPTIYNWRIRFAADEVGRWEVVFKLKVKGEVVYTEHQTFDCGDSEHKGYLKTSKTNTAEDRYLFYSKSEEPFFAVGGNITHSSYDFQFSLEENERHKMWLEKLSDAGGNFFRLELGPQTVLPDWKDVKNYSARMREMFLFDDLIEFAQLKELYFILFRHHTEAELNWEDSPYLKEFNLGENPAKFFTSEEIRKYQENTLRYIFARWAYSPNFSFYEYQEADRWMHKSGAPISGAMAKKHNIIFKDWFNQNVSYIKNDLRNNRVLMSVAYAVLPSYEVNKSKNGIFNECDITTLHTYGSRPYLNFEKRHIRTQKMWRKINKPLIIEEIGDGGDQLPLLCCTDITFHNDLWATSMMGGFGTGLHWWWDRGIYLNNYQKQYKNVQSFFEKEELRKWQMTPQKWQVKNRSKKIYLENYALISKNKERALGWVRNSSVHWRNLYENDSCIKYLIDHQKTSFECKFEDGWSNINSSIGFDDPKYKFEDGKVHPIVSSGGIKENPTFEIAQLNANPFQLFKRAKRHWYKIEFYSTRELQNGTAKLMREYTQIIHTSNSGKLKPNVPNLTVKNADWAYKVTYLGIHKREPK